MNQAKKRVGITAGIKRLNQTNGINKRVIYNHKIITINKAARLMSRFFSVLETVVLS
ncbi:hypothetical protein JCM17380_43930 [Desulfosporosinus burensis]